MSKEKSPNILPLAVTVLGGVATHLALKSKRYQKRAEYMETMATHDNLTGLLNQRGLEEALNKSKPPKGVLYIDGTNQKAINDKISHDRGDDAIIGTAKVIRNSLRPGDVAARVGGDEFLVLLSDEQREKNHDYSTSNVLGVVQTRMHEETQDFLQANPDLQELGFDIAVGGVIWEEGMTVQTVKETAERAMYDSKAQQHASNGQYRSA